MQNIKTFFCYQKKLEEVAGKCRILCCDFLKLYKAEVESLPKFS